MSAPDAAPSYCECVNETHLVKHFEWTKVRLYTCSPFTIFCNVIRFNPCHGSLCIFRVDAFCLAFFALFVLKVDGFCLPWEVPCGGNWGCYTEQQRCDGYWHCPNGRDELNCSSCQEDEFPCSRNGACYPRSDRCNYQNRCPNGSDEKNCFFCQPGNFHCKVQKNKKNKNQKKKMKETLFRNQNKEQKQKP